MSHVATGLKETQDARYSDYDYANIVSIYMHVLHGFSIKRNDFEYIEKSHQLVSFRGCQTLLQIPLRAARERPRGRVNLHAQWAGNSLWTSGCTTLAPKLLMGSLI